MKPASQWRVVLLFVFWTLVVASLNRRVSGLLPALEPLFAILAICLAAGLTAAFIARRGEFIPPAAAALAVSIPICLMALALILVASNNPDIPLHVLGLSYGAAILVYGIPNYWLLTKLPSSGWLPTKARELSVPPAELARGFLLFPMAMLAVCGLIVLVISGVLFWINET